MAATEPGEEDRRGGTGAVEALLQAALALPILVVPARAGAAESGEVGIALLRYEERGLMKVTEPVVWGRLRVGEAWELQASAAVDIVSGASPQLVSNRSGQPVQTITGASVQDRRKIRDAKVTRRRGPAQVSVSRTVSREEDYTSRAYGLEGRYEVNERLTTLIAGLGRASDRVRSSDDARLDEPRRTREYLVGVAQVLSPVSALQSTLTFTDGAGFYNDPYKLTFTFFAQGLPVLIGDRRPRSRETLAWLNRYRHHVPSAQGTLHADYRFYRDDWGIRAHTLEVAWQQSLGERWFVRPSLRYYSQNAARFYSPVAPGRDPEHLSSDQRLAAFGGLSPALAVGIRLDQGTRVEASAGYLRNDRRLRLGGAGSSAFETLRAWYGVVSVAHEF